MLLLELLDTTRCSRWGWPIASGPPGGTPVLFGGLGSSATGPTRIRLVSMRQGEPLFGKADIFAVLEAQKASLSKGMEQLDPDYLLKVSEQDCIAYIVNSYLAKSTLLEERLHPQTMP
jgi:hypothetical protein